MNQSNVAAPADTFNLAAHLLARNEGRGAKTAYIDDHGSLTFAELQERVQRMASALHAAGIRREERVLLLMLDSNDWPVAFLGAMYAGVVPVAVNTLLTPEEYAYILGHCRARTALVSGSLVPILTEAANQAGINLDTVVVSRPEGPLGAGQRTFADFIDAPAARSCVDTGPDDFGFWLYSSGSTGRPKGTVHTHANPYWSAELYGRGVLGIEETDTCFSAAKLFFAYGLGNALYFPLSVGATTVLMAERPTPEAVFARWIEHQPTIFFGAPTGYAGMLASPALPDRSEVALRLASSAGEALPANLGERFTAHFGAEVVDGIGSTEMVHIYLSNTPGNVRYGTTGRPVPGYDIELRSEDGGQVEDGEPGDLYVRGPSAAMMYWGNRERSRETFQGEWTKSGDKFVRNPDGTFSYAGRSDDMLKVSGIYVSPFEVEATLSEHPAVLESAVIGVEDAEGLTKSKAFVVLNDGAEVSAHELQAFVKDRLAPYKYPRVVEFVSELPKTATGKIQRFKLREREAEASR